MNKMDTFNELIRRQPNFLQLPLEKLIPISFIGDSAVAAYRTLVGQLKRSDKLDEQNRSTLKDGQNAGKMQLYIQAAIGERLIEDRPDATGKGMTNKDRQRAASTGSPMSRHQRLIARTIAKHPEAIEKTIREAEENDDIPTKTGVVHNVELAQGREHRKEEQERIKSEYELSAEAFDYFRMIEGLSNKLRIERVPDLTEKSWALISKELIDLRQQIDRILFEGNKIVGGGTNDLSKTGALLPERS